MWVGGTRFGTPDGQSAFREDIWGGEMIRYSLSTYGLHWDEGKGVQSGQPGWYFEYDRETMLQIFTVDKDCFFNGSGTGRDLMFVQTTMIQRVNASANAKNGFFGCDAAEDSQSHAIGYYGMSEAAIALNMFNLAGWGFGEWIRLEQSTVLNQPSRVVAHDESCADFWGVSGGATVFGMYSGGAPPLFYGPKSPRGTTYANAGSYSSSQIGPGETTTRLARARDAICYLTGLSGKFKYNTEAAWMTFEQVNGVYYWDLVTRAGDDGSVFATANCYAFDQTY
jgi:hypothetical protein